MDTQCNGSTKAKSLENTNKLFCDTCSIFVPNDASLQAHLKGQKHARNLEREVSWTEAAKRSVYVGGVETIPAVELSLADYFSQFGTVKKITTDKSKKRYAIVELENEQTAVKVLQGKNHTIYGTSVIIKPREIKLFKPPASNKQRPKPHPVMDELWNEILSLSMVSDQILLLEQKLKLSEEESHVRRLICQLLESALLEVFPECTVEPYGSSVNGFGTHGCDLDLHFAYDKVHPDLVQELLLAKDESGDDPPENVARPAAGEADLTRNDVLMAIGEIIKQCVPDCHRIKVITTARTPVVRFYHKGSSVKCDMSLSNELAVNNTAYLQYCCKRCPLMKPLVYLVRTWMKHWELAGGVHVSGPRLNNYAVTLLVLFYLQHTEKLPSLVNMRRAVACERRVIEGWDCSFPANNEHSGNSDSCLEVLVDWASELFTFYSKVEFSKVVLSLDTASLRDVPPPNDPPDDAQSADCSNHSWNESDEGARIKNFKYGPLNVQDPFELSHNVTGNVTSKHMLNVVRCLHNAGVVVKMKRFRHRQLGGPVDWGIRSLFVDHHRKQTVKDKADAASSSSCGVEVGFQVKLRCVSGPAPSHCRAAMGLVVTVLRDVFGIACELVDNDVEHNKTDPGSSQILVSCDETVASVRTCPKSDVGEAVTVNVGEKRPASPSDCSYVKRAKVVLIAPPVQALTEGTPTNVSLPCQFLCAATKRLWQGRRKARRKLVQQGKADLLQLEKQVSRLLLTDLDSSNPDAESHNTSLNSTLSSDSGGNGPIFRFLLKADAVKNAELTLRFQCLTEEGKSDFINFFHHVEAFIPGFVGKCMEKLTQS